MKKNAITTYVIVDSRSSFFGDEFSVYICPAYALPRTRVPDPSLLPGTFLRRSPSESIPSSIDGARGEWGREFV